MQQLYQYSVTAVSLPLTFTLTQTTNHWQGIGLKCITLYSNKFKLTMLLNDKAPITLSTIKAYFRNHSKQDYFQQTAMAL